MADLLGTFRQKGEEVLGSIQRAGGLRATIESLRRQMAEADRKRAMNKVRAELRRLDAQITEMVTAVGVQAVGLHKAGALSTPELQPLCAHIVELEAAVAEQRTELARLEALAAAERAPQERRCAHCGQRLAEGGTFCPHCGQPAPTGAIEETFCAQCGARLRPQAKFCSRCGRSAG